MLPHSRYPLVIVLRRFSSAAPLGNAVFFPPLPERPLDPAPPGSSRRTTGGGKEGGLGPLATMGLLGAAAWMMTTKEPRSRVSLPKERVKHETSAAAHKSRLNSALPSSSLIDGPHTKS